MVVVVVAVVVMVWPFFGAVVMCCWRLSRSAGVTVTVEEVVNDPQLLVPQRVPAAAAARRVLLLHGPREQQGHRGRHQANGRRAGGLGCSYSA